MPPLLFEAAFYIHWNQLRRDFPVVPVLATLGVVLSASVTSLGMHYGAHWPWAAALTFGVLIAATDPVSVIATFEEAKVRGRLLVLIEAESLFNDGTAAVAFGVVVGIALGQQLAPLAVTVLLLKTIGGGILSGAAVAVGFIANSLVFLLIGMHAARQHLVAIWVTALLAIALVTLGRAVAIYPSCLLFARSALGVPMKHQHLLVWGGLRGAVALALALGLPPEVPQRDSILSISFAVVAFSIFVQGLSMPWFLHKMGESPGRAK